MAQSDLLALILGVCLGLWAFYSGNKGVRSGKILAASRHVRRAEQPVTFWFAVLVLRYTLGILLIAGGVYQGLFQGSA